MNYAKYLFNHAIRIGPGRFELSSVAFVHLCEMAQRETGEPIAPT